MTKNKNPNNLHTGTLRADPLMRLLLCALFCTALSLSTAATAQYSPGLTLNETLLHDGHTRYFDVYVPASYNATVAVPLIVDLHGLGSNKTQQRGLSGMQAQADIHNIIVVYPLGLHGDPLNPEDQVPPGSVAINLVEGPSWNAGFACCGKALTDGEDDVGFMQALVAHMASNASIDLTRVYASGLSNGGAMSQWLACQASDTFAATAPVAFPAVFDSITDCPLRNPVSVIAVQSYTDLLVPYNGGPLVSDPINPTVPSAAMSFDNWRAGNLCLGSTPDTAVTTGATGICQYYENCDDDTQVALCSVSGDPAFLGHIPQINTDGLNVAASIVAFFLAQSLGTTHSAFHVPIGVQPFALLALLSAIPLFSKQIKRRR